MPSTRRAFWETKLTGNVARDGRIGKQLEALGWQAITVWECELSNEELVAERLTGELRNRHA